MVSDVIGLLSGLLAMFTFLTGTTSARDLILRAGGQPAVEPTSRRRLWLVFGVSAPVFVLSMVVTLNAGLDGSDTGGAQFVLLLIGALLLVAYALRWSRSMRWTAFLVTCFVVLGSLGLLMGAISRGEEAESHGAGLVVGLGVGLLALAFRPRTGNATVAAGAASAPDPSRPGQTAREWEILALVQERGGEVTAFDVGLHTSLSLHEAREILDRLAAGGFCQRRVTPDGATIYRFPDARTAAGTGPKTGARPEAAGRKNGRSSRR